ncbi:uncharacterized protein LOC130732522 isoform X2 [Lotus japonicus]|uniref:uncharacterized protein LOC130732522 isoform X2 n=1 Tax=Lotus japonicus TaxID=34305 RepID=UPI0025845B03|nr:uncharacterized protein LOC130732522 isoform X2 [Lotus japonicus]
MGCGISTMEVEEPSHTRRSIRPRQRVNIPPINKPIMKKDYDNGDDGDDGDTVIMKPLIDVECKQKMKDERTNYNGDKLREEKIFVEVKEKEEHGVDDKHVKNECGNGGKLHVMNVRNEEENEERDDSFIGPGSPSFREYCNDNDSVDRSSLGDSNDCNSEELSTKNGSDDDSTNRTESEKSVNSNKEPEKKERRGRGFRNVMNRGRARGKRNLLNFACYNTGNQSYAEGSLNKVVGKTA